MSDNGDAPITITRFLTGFVDLVRGGIFPDLAICTDSNDELAAQVGAGLFGVAIAIGPTKTGYFRSVSKGPGQGGFLFTCEPWAARKFSTVSDASYAAEALTKMYLAGTNLAFAVVCLIPGKAFLADQSRALRCACGSAVRT